MNELVSVIIPVYNTAEYMAHCLDSVCGQTYTNLEILCVDDGSTDATPAILAEYVSRDPRIRVISQQNAGVSAARNKATALARGEWVFYVDSDDWLELDILENLVALIEPEVDVISHSVVLEWEDGVIPAPGTNPYFTRHEEAVVLPCTPESSAHLNRAVWGKLWRRSVIMAHEVHSPVGLRHEDDAFFYFFMRHCRKIALCPAVGYHYLQRGTSFMNSGHTPAETARIYEKVFRYVCDFVRKSGANPVECVWCRTFLTRLHAERYAVLPPELRAETSGILYELALAQGYAALMRTDYRFRCMKPVTGWRRRFLSRYLNSELWRVLGVPVWEVEYRDGVAFQQRFMLLRFIGWKLGINC